MIKLITSILCIWSSTALYAQQSPAAEPDPGNISPPVVAAAGGTYTPPTHAGKFREYLHRTYNIRSFVEAGARAGIDMARDKPSEWQEGAAGYAERFGSAAGLIVVRGTTEYAFSEIFKEDLRIRPCGSNCSTSRFKAALEDTFTARKGEDGHRAFSIARLVGPISGSLVAGTWRPGGFERREIVGQVAITYGLVFMRNLIREYTRP